MGELASEFGPVDGDYTGAPGVMFAGEIR